MNILLINPPENFEEKKHVIRVASPPLGLMYIKEMIKDNHVEIIDLSNTDTPEKDMYGKLKSKHWDVIGVSVMSYTLPSVLHTLKKIKEVCSDAFLIAGGVHASFKAEECLELGFDSVIIGDGELVINNIIENKLKGVIKGKEISDLDSLPFPNGSIKELGDYIPSNSFPLPDKCSSIITSRGCPHDCNFCGRPKKRKHVKRSPENVLKELIMLECEGYRNIYVVDDNFTTNLKWIKKLVDIYSKENLDMRFFCSSRVDNFTQDMAKQLKRLGVYIISFGIESVNPEVIRFYNKYRYPERWKNLVEDALKNCNSEGIYSQASLIVGAPMETEKIFYESYGFVKKQKPDLINVNVLTYMIGSKIWNDAVKEGLVNQNEYSVSVLDRPDLALIEPDQIEAINRMVFDDVNKNLKRHALLKTIMHLDKFKLKILFNWSLLNLKRKFDPQGWTLERNELIRAGYGFGN